MAPRPNFKLPDDGFNELAMCRAGPMIFNKYDRYIGASLRKYGEFSFGEADLFRQMLQPGMVVVEVGANIGAHTVAMSRMVGDTGTILAFEPQRIVFQTLCANLALNSCKNVFARQSAIGAETGAILGPQLRPDAPENFGGVSLENVSEGEAVLLNRLDDFGIAACHLLKIDIEGMEVPALRGGADLIARTRPVIYVENDREDHAQELISVLRSFKYKSYNHLPDLYTAANFANDPENIFPNIVSKNLLCFPAESNVELVGLTEAT